MTTTKACECLYNGIPVTIKSLTNAQSYCVKKVFPCGNSILATLTSCRVDYRGKAVDIDTRHIVTADVNVLNEIRIADYDNY